jgi:hypothetical protein
LAEETEVFGENLPLCRFVYHKSHTTWDRTQAAKMVNRRTAAYYYYYYYYYYLTANVFSPVGRGTTIRQQTNNTQDKQTITRINKQTTYITTIRQTQQNTARNEGHTFRNVLNVRVCFSLLKDKAANF